MVKKEKIVSQIFAAPVSTKRAVLTLFSEVISKIIFVKSQIGTNRENTDQKYTKTIV